MVSQYVAARGFAPNPNYRGGMGPFELANADCTEMKNCCVWVTRIPAHATNRDLLAVIYEGKIFATTINAAELAGYGTAAAKIIFMARDAADAFMARALSDEGVSVLGRRIHVEWNRNRVKPRQGFEREQSRVLKISAPWFSFTGKSLVKLLHLYVDFQLVENTDWTADGLIHIVLTFDSVRGQSRAAVGFLQSLFWGLSITNQCMIQYLDDPCDRPPQSSRGRYLPPIRI